MIIVDIDSSCLFTQRRHKIQELKHIVSVEREVVVVLVAEADWKLGLPPTTLCHPLSCHFLQNRTTPSQICHHKSHDTSKRIIFSSPGQPAITQLINLNLDLLTSPFPLDTKVNLSVEPVDASTHWLRISWESIHMLLIL